MRGDRLDQNHLGKLFTDGKPGVTNLANEIVATGDEPHDLILTKPQFPQAILHFRRGAKLLDAHRHARLNAAQRADFAAAFFAWTECFRRIHTFAVNLPDATVMNQPPFAFWRTFIAWCGQSHAYSVGQRVAPVSKFFEWRQAGSTVLLFETGAGWITNLETHLTVVRTGFGQCAIAPAMTAVLEAIFRNGEHLIRLCRDEHFFGAKMSADVVRFHSQAVSCASVRRTSARTIGIL